jgi:diguanylate cyclase (GGDEF)-like protein
VGLGRAFLAERSRLRSDPLTCAVGRRYGSEQLAARIAAEVPFSLAFLDLRDFKGINDRYGHAVGDEVLCQVATRLACAVSPGDLVMRYGGDEFVVASGAPELSARLQRALTSPLPTSAGPLALQVDIGEARWRAGETLAALLTRADAAMYGRKTAARSRPFGLATEHPETR